MSTPVITIFVRHGNGPDGKPCKYSGDEFSRRCNCRKHFRWTQNGTQYRRKAGTRSWEEAEEVKRQLQDQLAGRTPEQRPEDNVKPISEAITLFITDKKVQGVSAGVVSRYECELGRFREYCEREGIFTVQRVTRELLTGYAGTWEQYYPASTTRASVRERLRSFLRYCYECKWLERVPAVPKVEVDEVPTLPLSDAEYTRLLKTIDKIKPLRWDSDRTKLLSETAKQRLRALMLLMRWSGLAIQDAVTLPKTDILFDRNKKVHRVVTNRQKTGTHVSVPLPTDVAKEILSAPAVSEKYLFWTGTGKPVTAARLWGRRYIRPLFEAAGLAEGHMLSHRLRDTFAVDLLQKGVDIEHVAKALGDTVRVTEKHYAKWMKGRQDRLDSLVMGTWTTPKARKRRHAA
jgi:site-specific recombinase XerD